MLEQAKRPDSSPKSASASGDSDSLLRRPMDREVDPFGPKLEAPPTGPQSFSEDKAPTGAEAQAHEIGDAIAADLPRGLNLSHGALPSSVSEVAERHVGVPLGAPQMSLGGDGQRMAKQQGALAVAEGDTISVAAGELSTGTEYGRAVLGHELTHVAQQRVHGTRAKQRIVETSEKEGLAEAQKSEAGLDKYLGERAEQTRKTKGILNKKHPTTPEEYRELQPDLERMVRLIAIGIMATHRAKMRKKQEAFLSAAREEIDRKPSGDAGTSSGAATPATLPTEKSGVPAARPSPIADLRKAAQVMSRLEGLNSRLEGSELGLKTARAKVHQDELWDAIDLLKANGLDDVPAHELATIRQRFDGYQGKGKQFFTLALEQTAHELVELRGQQIAGTRGAISNLYDGFPVLAVVASPTIADEEGEPSGTKGYRKHVKASGARTGMLDDEVLLAKSREAFEQIVTAINEAIGKIATGSIHAFDLPIAVSTTSSTLNPDVAKALKSLVDEREADKFWTEMFFNGVSAVIVLFPVLGPALAAGIGAVQAGQGISDLLDKRILGEAAANPYSSPLGVEKPTDLEWVIAGVDALLSAADLGGVAKEITAGAHTPMTPVPDIEPPPGTPLKSAAPTVDQDGVFTGASSAPQSPPSVAGSQAHGLPPSSPSKKSENRPTTGKTPGHVEEEASRGTQSHQPNQEPPGATSPHEAGREHGKPDDSSASGSELDDNARLDLLDKEIETAAGEVSKKDKKKKFRRVAWEDLERHQPRLEELPANVVAADLHPLERAEMELHWGEYVDYYDRRVREIKAGKTKQRPLDWESYGHLFEMRRGTRFQKGVLEKLRSGAKEGTILEENVGLSKKYVMSGKPKDQLADRTKVRRDIRFVDILEVTRADLAGWVSGAKLKAKGYSLKSRKFFKLDTNEIKRAVGGDIEEALDKYAGGSQLHRSRKVKSGESEIGAAASKRAYSEVEVDPIVLVYDMRGAQGDRRMIQVYAEKYAAQAKARRGWNGTFEIQFL